MRRGGKKKVATRFYFWVVFFLRQTSRRRRSGSSHSNGRLLLRLARKVMAIVCRCRCRRSGRRLLPNEPSFNNIPSRLWLISHGRKGRSHTTQLDLRG